jgi:CDP-diacylglycerol---glycerol-3-phosphate 3-phosphatidyltransferase
VNLPNALTVGRIFLVPLLVVVLLTKFDGRDVFGISNEMLGAVIFGLASFTDWLDGFVARRRGQVTPFGQWMDPLADKLLVTAALISLVQLGRAPAWMVAIILGREFSVTVLRSIVHARGQTLPASPLGKIKMVAEVVAILVLILGPREVPGFYVFGHIALWIATIAALVSAIDYSRRFNAVLSGRASTLERPAPAIEDDDDAATAQGLSSVTRVRASSR